GVATLTVTGNQPGSITITASATGSGGVLAAGSGNPITFNVVAGAVDHFVFDAINSPQTQNAAFAITITAKDAVGNTVTNFGSNSNDKVILTSTGTLAGGPTVTTSQFTNGVLSGFNVTITNTTNNPPGFTITATGVGANSGKTGISNSFAVNPSTVNTSTAVTSNLNPSVYGQSVTFTATVTAQSGSNPPTGSVNFVIDGGSPIAGAPGSTTSTTATWTYTTSALSAATHTVSASFTHTGSFSD